MRKKVVWMILSCLIVTALVLASCGPAAVEEGEGKTVIGKVTEKEEAVVEEEEEAVLEGKDMVTLTLTKRDGTTMQVTKERPRYGGALTTVSMPVQTLDDIYGPQNYHAPWKNTHEILRESKWELGPSGTGEFRRMWHTGMPPMDTMGGGGVAESWELVDEDTMLFHIRKGVHFHNKPPVNGREMDANDVEFSLVRFWTTPPSGIDWDLNLVHVKVIDKWTVEIKCKPGRAASVYGSASGSVHIVPREVIDEYGHMNDWENTLGTGPFILTDFLADSSATYERNPNYWMNDPLFPENRLPYVDALKELYITDRSTINAAVRTGKVDFASIIYWEDVDVLLRSNPDLNYIRYLNGTDTCISWKMDNPELPWYDKRVRHAMYMAIDHQAIKDLFYGGNAEILAWPVLPVPDVDIFGDMIVPLEELPESTRKLYEYHPEEAKQLLAEAGYPDGFKAELVCMATDMDMMSIVKADLAKVGIELDLQLKEVGGWIMLGYGKAFTEMIRGSIDSVTEWSGWSRLGTGMLWNWSVVDDPIIEEARAATEAAGFDDRARTAPMTEIFPYIIDQAYVLTLCTGTAATMWHPWLKGYDGSRYTGSFRTFRSWKRFAWIDQDLKFEMIGQR